MLLSTTNFMFHFNIMKRTELFFIFIFLLLICISNRLYAASYGQISIQEIPLTSDLGGATCHGYFEYRFRITNKDTQAHTVGLEISSHSMAYFLALTRSTNSVVVPPKSAVILRLLQPALPFYGVLPVQVIIDGHYQDNQPPFRAITNNHGNYHPNDGANILTSRDVPGDLRNLFQSGIPSEKSENTEGKTEPPTAGNTTIAPVVHAAPSGTLDNILWPSSVPVEEWSDYWLAYTRFDAIVVTDSEWREIQEHYSGIFDAIQKYVEVGGILGIVGTNWNVPKHWLLVEEDSQNSSRKYHAVLGLVYTFDKNTEIAKPTIEPFRNTVLKQLKLWTQSPGTTERQLLSSLPVVADYRIDIKLIMVLIIVFAVLIGPINIYVLSLIKRRIWLIWTVPLTSLVAGVLVLGASLCQEGFVRQSSSATYTILDQQREETVTFGFVGFYSTLTPRGITFAPETEVTANVKDDINKKSLEFHLLAGGNQFLSHGWINARIPSYFTIRKAQSQRKERIIFDWTTGSPTAANGLGVDIKKLTVCSPTGELFAAHHIKAGEKVTLNVPSTLVEQMNIYKNVSKFDAFRERHKEYSHFIPNGPGTVISPNYLPAGSYLAELDVWNPFVEEGIDRTIPYQNKTIIFGLFE
jgi:hypothetical protein